MTDTEHDYEPRPRQFAHQRFEVCRHCGEGLFHPNHMDADTDTMERLEGLLRDFADAQVHHHKVSVAHKIRTLVRDLLCERDERLTVDSVREMLAELFAWSRTGEALPPFQSDMRPSDYEAADEYLQHRHGIEPEQESPEVDLEWPDDRTPETEVEPEGEKEKMRDPVEAASDVMTWAMRHNICDLGHAVGVLFGDKQEFQRECGGLTEDDCIELAKTHPWSASDIMSAFRTPGYRQPGQERET